MADTPKKILVIEDDKTWADLIVFKLKKTGFDTKVAYDGKQGLALVDQEKFDLILCDLIMPTLDGLGVLKGLQERKATTPIYILTNLTRDEDKEEALKLGAKDFLSKASLSIIEIVDKVKQLTA